jgi:hypothetical protein
MVSSTASPALHSPKRVRLFTPGMRVAWALVFGITILVESIPVPLVHPVLFYSFLALKAALFVALGYLTPLTFWRFDSLGLGVLFSVAGAMASELIQAISPGHSTSLKEITGKLLLLLFGFALALHARYDRRIHLGVVQLHLEDSHRKQQD